MFIYNHTRPPPHLPRHTLCSAASDMSLWRLLLHSRPHALHPVQPGHPLAPFIQSLVPTEHCNQTCTRGYCTKLPSVAASPAGNMEIVKGPSASSILHDPQGPLHIHGHPHERSKPLCDCFPDISHHNTAGGCDQVHPPFPAECLDSCSGIGTCARGFCSCPPGFWGPDCGLSIDSLGQPFAWKAEDFADSYDMSHADTMPRMFVYDIQPAWRARLHHTKCGPLVHAHGMLCRIKPHADVADARLGLT